MGKETKAEQNQSTTPDTQNEYNVLEFFTSPQFAKTEERVKKVYTNLYFLGIKDLRSCAQYSEEYFITGVKFFTETSILWLKEILSQKGLSLQT